MQKLRVLGLTEGGRQLVLTTVDSDADHAGSHQQQFTVPLDDQLRAAIRGDISRFGQLEIQMQSQLRPREIQARIRAGASVEQVAAAAGCAPDRVERYAYPVLMERATIAEQARAVKPLTGAAMGSKQAAHADDTLETIVLATLTDRGQADDVSWDAFRDERGWSVSVTWHAGRSENRAEWAYRPTVDGGQVTPRSDEAAGLVEPVPVQLRTIATESDDEDHSRLSQQVLIETEVADERSGAWAPSSDADSSSAPSVAAEVEAPAQTGTDGPDRSKRSAKRGHRPPMPSWEDVLLGTRSANR